MDYDKIGWEIKCGGKYFPHKVIKMAKGKKIVDDRVLKWNMIVIWKRATKEKKRENGIVFETMLHNSFYLTISKTLKS